MSIHQYKDYSEWIKKRDLSTQREFWLGLFADEVPIINLPLDFPRPKIKSYKGDIVDILIDKGLKNKILDLAM